MASGLAILDQVFRIMGRYVQALLSDTYKTESQGPREIFTEVGMQASIYGHFT